MCASEHQRSDADALMPSPPCGKAPSWIGCRSLPAVRFCCMGSPCTHRADSDSRSSRSRCEKLRSLPPSCLRPISARASRPLPTHRPITRALCGRHSPSACPRASRSRQVTRPSVATGRPHQSKGPWGISSEKKTRRVLNTASPAPAAKPERRVRHITDRWGPCEPYQTPLWVLVISSTHRHRCRSMSAPTIRRARCSAGRSPH